MNSAAALVVGDLQDVLRGDRLELMEPWVDVGDALPAPHQLVLTLCAEAAGPGEDPRLLYSLGMWRGHPSIAYCEDRWMVDCHGDVHVVGWMPIPPCLPPWRPGGAL